MPLCNHLMFLCHFETTQCFYATLQPNNVFMPICNHKMFLCQFPVTQCFYTTLQTPSVFMQLCNHQIFLCHVATIQCFYATLQPPNVSSVKWTDPGPFLKTQCKLFLSFLCTLFNIFLTPKNYKLRL